MSPSSIPTRLPRCASATARFTATVVLPTPPLPAPTAMTFFTPGTGHARAVGDAGRADRGRHLDLDVRHAGHLQDGGPRLVAHLVLHRARRRRQLDRESHPAAVDRQVLHEAQADDVAAEVGIAHGRERAGGRRFPERMKASGSPGNRGEGRPLIEAYRLPPPGDKRGGPRESGRHTRSSHDVARLDGRSVVR